MTEQLAFSLLGALIAVASILFLVVVFGGWGLAKLVGYAGHFKGFQGNRNAKNEMTFTAVIDETPPPPKPKSSRGFSLPKESALQLDGNGQPIPAKDLAN